MHFPNLSTLTYVMMEYYLPHMQHYQAYYMSVLTKTISIMKLNT